MDGCGANEGVYSRDDGTSHRKVFTHSDSNVTEISKQSQLPIRCVYEHDRV